MTQDEASLRRQASASSPISGRTLLAAVALVAALFCVGSVSAMTYYGGKIDRQEREQQQLRAELAEIKQAQAQPQVLAPTPDPTQALGGGRKSHAGASIGVEQGADSEVLAGTDGSDGADGEDGLDGLDGADGAAGAPGAPGGTGPQGDPGASGADGAAGRDGADGRDGRDGTDGAGTGHQY